ncbi:MAG: filamentous hemagglutinin family protein [Pseudomonadota bacterium]
MRGTNLGGRLTVCAAAAFMQFCTLASVPAAELPIPCIAGSCGPQVPAFVQSGQASATAVGNTLNINQTTDRAILNWRSFNVSADGRVIFTQPDSSSIALNRIHQESPSRIFGAVEANGQIYLVNQNGIIFGAGAKVKTAGLLASTLNISDEVFASGIVSPDLVRNGRPALLSDGRASVIDAQGNPVRGADGKPLEIKLSVEQGAQLTTGSGGRVILASRNVENAGRIDTPDGQVLVAAGEKVYLVPSSDASLRGLLVEVDSGGTAWNQLTGDISAARGNVTIAGLAVNQDGRISATTTVSANGSIRLLGRDTVRTQTQGGNITLNATHGGSVTLGSGSSTTVLPELTDKATAVDDQAQDPSRVEISAQRIALTGGARIVAPGGTVTLQARADPSAGIGNDAQSQIRMGSGAVIDVAGSTASAAVERNLVTVEMRANELRDSPLQRDGVVRGRAVVVDARVGTPFGDVSGALASLPRDIAERTSRGGTVELQSQGDVVMTEGSRVDVSGGAIVYRPGVIQTSMLVTENGQAVDIGHADPNVRYVGVINPQVTRRFDRWGVVETISGPQLGHYDPGYVEGRAAGVVRIEAPAMLLNGNFEGHATPGIFQRDPATIPAGGRLIIGASSPFGDTGDFRAPSITLVNSRPTVVVGPDAPLPGNVPLELPVEFLTRGGFTTAELNSNGTVSLRADTPLTLSPGSTLNIRARAVDIQSDITASSGSLQFAADFTADIPGASLSAPVITIGDGVTLDVRGRWQNDLVDPLGPVYRNGGSIDLAVRSFQDGIGRLQLGDGVMLRASGGASMSASGVLTGGAGGRISLRSGSQDSALAIGENVCLDAFGVQGASGGRFTLETRRLEIGTQESWSFAQDFDPLADLDSSLRLGDALFRDHGFATFELIATGPARSAELPDALTVLAGTSIDARVRRLEIDGAQNLRGAESTVEGFTRNVLAPEYQQAPVSIALRVDPRDLFGRPVGRLNVEQNSVIAGASRSTFSFASPGGVRLAGQVYSMGGTINVSVPNAAPAFDVGFLPELQLELTSTARLDVSGGTLLRPSDIDLKLGDVLAGGSVNLLADRGSVFLRSGSSVNVSGASASLDLPSGAENSGYVRQTIASAGGALTVRAPESILLGGEMRGFAGSGGALAAPGGSLSVQLTRRRGFAAGDPGVAETYPTTPRVIRVIPDSFAGQPGNGLAVIESQRIAENGFDALHLETDGILSFDAGVTLSLGRQLRLESPVIDLAPGATTRLDAPYIALGPTLAPARVVAATSGSGSLEVNAGFIDAIGDLVFQRADHVSLHSSGDMRLRGVQDAAGINRGSLQAAGELALTASQIYPSTQSVFRLDAGAEGVLRIGRSGGDATTPLSAGGSLTLSAREIQQGGTLLAPFGTLTLNGTESVDLQDGSVTSVAATDLLVPFGRVELGEQWFYNGVEQQSIPERRVAVDSANVNIAAGATIDLRGGGDLYGYNFLPGTGGSVDVLDAAAGNGYYAVLPSLRGGFAPYDPVESAGSPLRAGDSVYLSGTAGLAAGVYPLLPPRYALLPGAVLVRRVAGFTDIVPGGASRLPDGTSVIAGYRTFASSGLGETRFSGFAVTSNADVRKLASYEDFRASTFFPARAERLDLGAVARTQDAGTLGLFASTTLAALGNVRAAAATGGRGALVDIAAHNLEIGPGDTRHSPDAVRIDAERISSWNAASVLFGGRRTSNGTAIESVADQILFDDGATLGGAELIAVADSSITVANGAQLGTSAGGSALVERAIDVTSASGADPAVLALSSSNRLVIGRPDASTATGSGRAILAAGSSLTTTGSLLIDAADGTLDGEIVAAGAEVDLVSNRLTFGEQLATEGLTFTSQVLDQLRSADALRFESRGVIDFLQSVQLGSDAAPLGSIALVGGMLRAADSVDVAFAANRIELGGANAPGAAGAAGGATFSLAAEQIDLQPGFIDFDGFSMLNFEARDTLLANGAVSLRAPADLSIFAGQLSVASGGNAELKVTGDLSLRGSTQAASSRAPGLGGELQLAGRNLDIDGQILLPSGLTTLNATQRLRLGANARIDVSGVDVVSADHRVSSPGGWITLSAGTELIGLEGSMLALNGGTGTAAGRLSISSPGTVQLRGAMQARSDAGAAGGALIIDAGSLPDFAALAAGVEAGGFRGNRDVRMRTGDLEFGAGLSWNARHISLASDSGAVRVHGSLRADSDNERSNISLFGGRGVTVGSGARLSATGGGTLGRGGVITVSASGGSVDLAPGAILDVTGTHEAGRVTVRAPALANDIAVDRLGATVRGTNAITLEPTLAFDAVPEFLDAFALDGYAATAHAWYDTAAALIQARLGNASPGVSLLLQPNLELRRTGDLQLSTADFSGWRFNGEPAAITFRAGGALTVNGDLSDGFVLPDSRYVLGEGRSATLSLIAGADFTAANVQTVNAASNADLSLIDAVVRTGTGELSLIAARDVVFAGTRASAYTAGLAGQPNLDISGTTLVEFPTGGGALAIRAGRDVAGSEVVQAVGAWQPRRGRLTGAVEPVRWGVDVNAFGWNAGTLGGGDLSVQAGRDVSDLTAATADSGYGLPDGSVARYAGGVMSIEAGRDVGSPFLHVTAGSNRVSAGGDLARTRIASVDGELLGALFSMQNARLDVLARGDVAIETIFNPTMLVQTQVPASQRSYFFTYGDDAGFSASSVSGDLSMMTSPSHVGAFIGNQVANNSGASLRYAPPSLALRALDGDITLGTAPILFPAPASNLELFAGRDLNLRGSSIRMSDAAFNTLPIPTRPAGSPAVTDLTRFTQALHHVNDLAPARITAGRDILGGDLALPKAARVQAGRDIRDFTLTNQNLRATDQTLIAAGRDFTISSAAINANIEVGGPGRLDVLAGRNIDLGFSKGISTIGSLRNPNLGRVGGAAITAMAGFSQPLDTDGFTDDIVAPSSVYRDLLVEYVESQSGAQDLTYDIARAQFNLFREDRKRPFLFDVFFRELVLAGREANTVPGSNFERGYAAIDSLFPASRDPGGGKPFTNPYAGDLKLAFSRIYTLDGGDISLLVPGGIVDVGLAIPPAIGAPTRTPSDLGIVAQRAGDVRIYSAGDVLVNQSRVFTLLGGDIAIWSTRGDIDAGRGAKSSISAPPPRVVVDDSGRVVVDLSGAVAGSGIRAILTDQTVKPGDVDLIAPAGIVNAGDAGIGSAGNLNVAAQQVVGLDNIQVGGASTGVPAETSNLGASLSGVSAVSSSASSAASKDIGGGSQSQSAPLAESAVGWLDVFLEGFGEAVCKPNDTECLNREQQRPKQ